MAPIKKHASLTTIMTLLNNENCLWCLEIDPLHDCIFSNVQTHPEVMWSTPLLLITRIPRHVICQTCQACYFTQRWACCVHLSWFMIMWWIHQWIQCIDYCMSRHVCPSNVHVCCEMPAIYTCNQEDRLPQWIYSPLNSEAYEAIIQVWIVIKCWMLVI